MGITIHYKGCINDIKLIDKCTDELNDIMDEIEWKHRLINDDKLNIKGIYIEPPVNCEGLSFLFEKSSGVLMDRLILFHPGMENDQYIYNHTKTQYAPIEVHITIIKLLKYLKGKYISDLDVSDDGDYWDTENADLLRNKFAFLNEMMDKLAGELEKIDKEPDESEESLLNKIEDAIRKMKKDNDDKQAGEN